MDNDRPKRQNFKRYPVGYFHIDIAELRTNEDKRYLFVAIDRTGKFAVAQLVDKANRKTVWEFLVGGLVGSEESDLGFPLHPEYAIQTDANWYFLHGIFG